MFLTVEKLEKRTRQLEAFRYFELACIAPMVSMEGGLGRDEVYTAIPGSVQGPELCLNDDFRGRDRYLWVQKKLRLPERRDGCRVVGLFDYGRTGGGGNSGFESLLYVNGEPWQGVDSNHTDVLLEDFAGREVELTFLLWSGLEGGGPKATQYHRVQAAHVGYLHCNTDAFYYLSKAIYKTVKLLPDTAPEKHALTAALDNAYRCISWDTDKFYTTVDRALESLNEALAKMEKHSDITVNAVGHTHIDVAWLWRLKHTREKAQRSFSTVLRLMEEFDDYIFLQTQPQLYQYIKRDCPALYDQIRARVSEGRWEPDGGMWVEADCNISSGEALVRQFLHGTAFFREEFGTRCEYLWLPDVFGYSWALPQILRQCGIDTFVTTKISWNQYNTIPHDLFRWRGIDGTEILTYFITTPEINHPIDSCFSTYNGMISPRSVLGSWQKFHDKAVSNETLISYGFGDGGGGANRNMLKMRRAMDRLPGLPNVKTSTARDFLRRAHERVENSTQYVHTWDGELYLEYHRGTYTSQAENKRYNRKLENAAAAAEWLCAASALSGGEYPRQALHDIWECVLLHQFHDIIPGSSIREVYEDSAVAYARAEQSVCALTRSALAELTGPEKHAFTLYNSGSFERRDTVVLPVAEDGCFYDGDAPLSAQKTDGGWLVTVDMEPLSMKAVAFRPGTAPAARSSFAVDLAARRVETPRYRIDWNDTGNLTAIYDRSACREVLAGEGNILEIYEDKPLHYDNWDIDIFYTEKRETARLTAVPQLLEDGPERCVIRFLHRYNRSVFTRDMILYRDSPRIDFACVVEWAETDRLLKVAFPVEIRATKATYDIQFGHVERPTHFNTSWDWARFEVVGHKWADLSETDYGVSLLNECKYGYNIKDNVMRLTLLKSTKFPDTDMDMGAHRFTYALLPHTGTVTQGGTIEQSVQLNLPVQVVPGAPRDIRRIVKMDSNRVHIDALKKAEKEDCLVLRIHECRGSRGALTITSDYPLRAWAPCNLLEEALGEQREGNMIHTEIKPFEIQTYKLWFR